MGNEQMKTECLLKSLGVWLVIVAAWAAVCHFTKEPQASADNQEVIRSLVQDKESGAYSLRQVEE